MKTEFETKVLDIDVVAIKKKLEILGAEYVGFFEQKRYIHGIVNPEYGKWIRLRSDGEKTTLCYKCIEANKIGGTKEIEFKVPDFEQTHEFLQAIGLPHANYQENRRTQYLLNGVEVDIDEWPLIPPYLEVEGKNEQEVLDTLELLGIPKEKTTNKDSVEVYEMYGIKLHDIKELRFADEK